MQDPLRKNFLCDSRGLTSGVNLFATDLVFNDLSHKLAIYRKPGAFYLIDA